MQSTRPGVLLCQTVEHAVPSFSSTPAGLNRLLCSGQIIHPKKISSRDLGAYISILACSHNKSTPHSIRIGGHTFFSIQNVHEDFVQFLERRFVNRTRNCTKARGLPKTFSVRPFLAEYQSKQYYAYTGYLGQFNLDLFSGNGYVFTGAEKASSVLSLWVRVCLRYGRMLIKLRL